MSGSIELSPSQRDNLLQQLCRGDLPDARGYFGPFGGCYAPEILMPALQRLDRRARHYLRSPQFRAKLQAELAHWGCRPTPLTLAPGLSERWQAEVWLKREDAARTGSHAINNALGQALLAKRAGASRVIAETGAGRHGLAAAAACRHVGLPCSIHMGAADFARHPEVVSRMRELDADIVVATGGDGTWCAAIDEAFRDWVRDPAGSHYLAGSVVGPHPYPWLVRELQKVVGEEARAQMLAATGALPDVVFAAVGRGAGATGLFHAFLGDSDTRLIGVEAGGRGADPGDHAATLCRGSPGIVHGSLTLWLQDSAGQLLGTHSIAAGMNHPGAGPEHALLQATGRAEYRMATDDEALDAVAECAVVENIRCEPKTGHALAGARRWAAAHCGQRILVCISGDLDADNPPREHPGTSSVGTQ